MPSPASPQRVALALASHFASAGMTQKQVAFAIGASQSQISRILSGRIIRRTRLFEKLCIYASSQLHFGKRPDVRRNTELMSALGEVWDGSDEHARALAQVIRSLAELEGIHGRFISKEVKR